MGCRDKNKSDPSARQPKIPPQKVEGEDAFFGFGSADTPPIIPELARAPLAVCLAWSARLSSSGARLTGSPLWCSRVFSIKKSASRGFSGSSDPCRYEPITLWCRAPSCPSRSLLPSRITRPSGATPRPSEVCPPDFRSR